MESSLSGAGYAPLEAVEPVKPASGYIGGKRNLAKRLVTRIRAIPHVTYVEPFVGMGGIFLRRDARPKAEVINDISGDVATFFRILQRHYQPFVDMLKWQITSRSHFARLMREDPSTLTDLERSVRFLYLQRLAFGGKVRGRTFGVSRSLPGRFDVTKLEPLLADIHERLAGVVIEQLPYVDVLKRYDSPETLFYLDPPYWGSEGDYGEAVFSREDFTMLAAALSSIKGRFLLSINDNPEVRATFSSFDIAEVPTVWTVGAGASKPVVELIVSGGCSAG